MPEIDAGSTNRRPVASYASDAALVPSRAYVGADVKTGGKECQAKMGTAVIFLPISWPPESGYRAHPLTPPLSLDILRSYRPRGNGHALSQVSTPQSG